MPWKTSLIVVALAVASQTSPCIADGALAIGLPADVARSGFASGNGINAPNTDAARAQALEGCRGSVGASEDARKLCKVIATFHDQCFAIALDPADGTPGVGWAVAASQDAANARALAQCRKTAGAKREKFCIIPDDRGTSGGCDGNAK